MATRLLSPNLFPGVWERDYSATTSADRKWISDSRASSQMAAPLIYDTIVFDMWLDRGPRHYSRSARLYSYKVSVNLPEREKTSSRGIAATVNQDIFSCVWISLIQSRRMSQQASRVDHIDWGIWKLLISRSNINFVVGPVRATGSRTGCNLKPDGM